MKQMLMCVTQGVNLFNVFDAFLAISFIVEFVCFFFQTQVIRAELMHRCHPESPLKRGAAASARIARRLGAGVEFTTRLSSGEYSLRLIEYVMTLYLGTPEKKFVLVMDTGSDLVWVQCQPCIRCYNQTGPLFDPSTSSSYSPVPLQEEEAL